MTGSVSISTGAVTVPTQAVTPAPIPPDALAQMRSDVSSGPVGYIADPSNRPQYVVRGSYVPVSLVQQPGGGWLKTYTGTYGTGVGSETRTYTEKVQEFSPTGQLLKQELFGLQAHGNGLTTTTLLSTINYLTGQEVDTNRNVGVEGKGQGLVTDQSIGNIYQPNSFQHNAPPDQPSTRLAMQYAQAGIPYAGPGYAVSAPYATPASALMVVPTPTGGERYFLPAGTSVPVMKGGQLVNESLRFNLEVSKGFAEKYNAQGSVVIDFSGEQPVGLDWGSFTYIPKEKTSMPMLTGVAPGMNAGQTQPHNEFNWFPNAPMQLTERVAVINKGSSLYFSQQAITAQQKGEMGAGALAAGAAVGLGIIEFGEWAITPGGAAVILASEVGTPLLGTALLFAENKGNVAGMVEGVKENPYGAIGQLGAGAAFSTLFGGGVDVLKAADVVPSVPLEVGGGVPKAPPPAPPGAPDVFNMEFGNFLKVNSERVTEGGARVRSVEIPGMKVSLVPSAGEVKVLSLPEPFVSSEVVTENGGKVTTIGFGEKTLVRVIPKSTQTLVDFKFLPAGEKVLGKINIPEPYVSSEVVTENGGRIISAGIGDKELLKIIPEAEKPLVTVNYLPQGERVLGTINIPEPYVSSEVVTEGGGKVVSAGFGKNEILRVVPAGEHTLASVSYLPEGEKVLASFDLPEPFATSEVVTEAGGKVRSFGFGEKEVLRIVPKADKPLVTIKVLPAGEKVLTSFDLPEPFATSEVVTEAGGKVRSFGFGEKTLLKIVPEAEKPLVTVRILPEGGKILETFRTSNFISFERFELSKSRMVVASGESLRILGKELYRAERQYNPDELNVALPKIERKSATPKPKSKMEGEVGSGEQVLVLKKETSAPSNPESSTKMMFAVVPSEQVQPRSVLDTFYPVSSAGQVPSGRGALGAMLGVTPKTGLGGAVRELSLTQPVQRGDNKSKLDTGTALDVGLVQGQSLDLGQKQVLEQAQAQKQEQAQEHEQLQVSELLPKEELKPVMPMILFDKNDKRDRRRKLFNVFVKKRGRFVRQNVQPLDLPVAVGMGRRVVEGSIAASFEVQPEESPGVNVDVSGMVPGRMYTRSKRSPNVFVQRRGTRLGSAGERRDIQTAKRFGGFRYQRTTG